MIDVLVESALWDSDSLTVLAETVSDAVLEHLGYAPQNYEIALLAGDNARIADLNNAFRDAPAAWGSLTLLRRETAG